MSTLTVSEAARRSGLSEPAIRYRIVKGEVPAIWSGGRLRIPADAVERLRGTGAGMRQSPPPTNRAA
jgi:excisionase family DNA binding protein